jgi:hypothetical protein
LAGDGSERLDHPFARFLREVDPDNGDDEER